MIAWFERRFGMSAMVTFVGAFISALGGVSGMPAFVVVFGALVAAGGALWSSGERVEFERGLREKSDEIADLNRQIAASVTGGDSFPYLTFASLGIAGPNAAILTLLNKSEHPLYEVNGYIADLQESRRLSDREQVPDWTWFKNIQGGQYGSE
jgi:hypothetical protein